MKQDLKLKGKVLNVYEDINTGLLPTLENGSLVTILPSPFHSEIDAMLKRSFESSLKILCEDMRKRFKLSYPENPLDILKNKKVISYFKYLNRVKNREKLYNKRKRLGRCK